MLKIYILALSIIGMIVLGTEAIAYDGAATGAELDYMSGVTSSVQDQIDANASDISTNEDDISTNTSDISTNTGNISTNTSDISTNTSDISTNESDISTNESDISTNDGRLDDIEGVEGIPVIESGTPSAADATDIAALLNSSLIVTDPYDGSYIGYGVEWDSVDSRWEYTGEDVYGFLLRNDADAFEIRVPTAAGTEGAEVTYHNFQFNRAGTLTIDDDAMAKEEYVDEEPHVIETSLATTTNSDDNKILFFSPGAITLTHVAVACEGTCTTPATITLEDGGSNAITPASAIEDGTVTENAALSYIAISSGGALLDGEIVRINTIADADPETDTYWFAFKYTVTH